MLEGKICLVTGSADGIGRATAVEMAEQGAGGVMVCDINDDKGAETVEMIRAKGVEAEYRHCDMAKPEDIRGLIDATVERFGGLDVLHNNAGVHESDFTTDLTVRDAARGDLRSRLPDQPPGPWLAMKYAAPHLRAPRAAARSSTRDRPAGSPGTR